MQGESLHHDRSRPKRAALLTLAKSSRTTREERLRLGEAQLRKVCRERGLDWDSLSEEARE